MTQGERLNVKVMMPTLFFSKVSLYREEKYEEIKKNCLKYAYASISNEMLFDII